MKSWWETCDLTNWNRIDSMLKRKSNKQFWTFEVWWQSKPQLSLSKVSAYSSLPTLGPVQDSGRGGRLLGRGCQPREFHGLWLVCGDTEELWGSREMELGLLAGLARAGRCWARAGISSRLRLTLPHWTLASHQWELTSQQWAAAIKGDLMVITQWHTLTVTINTRLMTRPSPGPGIMSSDWPCNKI